MSGAANDPGRNPSAETQLTLLEPARDVGAETDLAELARLYAYPETYAYPESAYPESAAGSRAWLRANFISSIDGGATVAGTSGGLAGTGDRAVFGVLRALADIIVVGAGTVRIENYAGAHLSVRQRQHRQADGQSEVPRLAIVTRSGRLDRDMRVFTETEVPPLVLTCTATAPALREQLAGRADVVDCSTTDPSRVDVAAALAAMAERGHHRVLTEGGPTLLGSFIDAGLLDELCLTIAPLIVGGAAPRIAGGLGRLRTPMRRSHLLGDGAGYLYARYVRDARG